MSVKFEVLKKVVELSGFKKRFLQSGDVLLAEARKEAARVKIPRLSDPALDIRYKKFMGCDVVWFRHKERCDRASLFIIGGGMIKYPRPSSLKKALKIAKETGIDLVVPYYPLCIDQSVRPAVVMLYCLYRQMLKRYPAEHVNVCGSSSGGCLALGLASYINAAGEGVPQPGSMYLASPGTFLHTPEDLELARELSKKDILMDWTYMETAREFCTGEDTPEYMYIADQGDYHGLKDVYLCYGGDESLFAGCRMGKESLERDGVHVTLEVGDGLYHCYPFFPLVKEAQAGWDHMIEYLKKA